MITYTANEQNVAIKFVDDDQQQIQVGDSVIKFGVTDQILTDFTSLKIAENYELADNQELPVSYQFTADEKQEIVIHLKHKRQDVTENHEVTRTIVDNIPGQEAVKTSQIAHFSRTGVKDLVTNMITWDDYTSTDNVWDEYLPIGKTGYTATANVDLVEVDPLADSTSITINYVPNNQSNTVTIIDDDNNGEILNTISINGKTDEINNWQVNLPENYQLADNQSNFGSYKFTAENQTPIIVHVTHKHEKQADEIKTVTRTIIENIPGNKAMQVTQKVNFTRAVDKDLVTGNLTYGAWTSDNDTWSALNVDQILGYTASQDTIKESKVTSQIQNQTININYTADPQSVTYYFIDDDRNGEEVSSKQINGKTDQTVKLNLPLPENYELVNRDSIPDVVTFSADNPDVFIHLKHKHELVPDSKTVTRTIIDHVPGQAAKKIIQAVNFTRTGDKDLVTGKMDYGNWQSDQTSWKEYQPDKVLAYRPNLSKIAEVDNLTPDDPDETIDITYTENQATATFNGRDERLNLDEIDLNLYHVNINSERISLKNLGISQEDLVFVDENGQEDGTAPGEYTVQLKQSAMEKIQEQFPDYHLSFVNKASFVLLNQQRIQYVDQDGNVVDEDTPIIGYDNEKKTLRPHLRHGWQFISFPKTIRITGGKTKIVVEHSKTTVTADDPKSTTEKLPHNSEMNYPSGVDQKDLNKKVTRTIVVNIPNKPTTIVQEASWARDAEVDEVTGQVTYGDWKLVQNGLTSYEAPKIAGYHSNIKAVEAATPTLTSKYADIQIDYIADAIEKQEENHVITNPTNNEISSEVKDNLLSYDISNISNIINIDNSDDITYSINITSEPEQTDMVSQQVIVEPVGLSLFREKETKKAKAFDFSGILAKSVLPDEEIPVKTQVRSKNLLKAVQNVNKANGKNNKETANSLPETGSGADYEILILGLLLSGLSLSGLFLKRNE